MQYGIIARVSIFKVNFLKLVSRIIPANLAEYSLLESLKTDEKYWPFSNIDMVYHIEKRISKLQDPTYGNRHLHFRWVKIFNEMFSDLEKESVRPSENFTYLYLGAGTSNIFSLPFLVYMAGASKCYVIEPDKEMKDFSIWHGLQNMLLRVCTGDVDSNFFVSKNEISEKIRSFFNGEAFLKCEDFRQYLDSSNIVFKNDYIEDVLDIPPRSIDLLSSRSTLEHVSDYESCFDKLEMVMRKGGIMYHDIGFGSHTQINKFLMYYVEKESVSQKDILSLNELRMSDFISSFTKRNFRCTVVRKNVLTDYNLDRAKLKERFRHYSHEDLLCERAVLVCEKL
ncbi:MAG: hypothetical protein CMN79_01450 [Spirochaetales bacterium]|nr:hypothetical protein [Spirochaetales bacterium]